MQLERYGVKLVDIYGVIGTQEVNTLEHLGVKYKWSVYSPTKKSEILEAERAKDEMRDIMSRMIGAEIRYTRLGYRVFIPPFGFMNEKMETEHGKRAILKPHPEESKWIIKMFELKAESILNDGEIVEKINGMGYKSRKQLLRNGRNRTQVIGERGGIKLSVKRMNGYIQNPVYAGILINKWTENQPIKGRFNGLISISLFNKANKGKVVITEENGGVLIYKDRPEDWRIKKQVINPNFPFKRYVTCPICKKSLFGSASRGKLGKHYPAYHCNKRGHYFRVPTGEFEKTITDFVKRLRITKEGIQKLKILVLEEWARRMNQDKKESDEIQSKIIQLASEVQQLGETIKKLTSDVAIKIVEEEIIEKDGEIKKLKSLNKVPDDLPMDIVMEIVSDFLEHLENLVLGSPDSLKRAAYFGLIFEEPPTYQDLISGTPKLAPYIKLTEELSGPKSVYVTRRLISSN